MRLVILPLSLIACGGGGHATCDQYVDCVSELNPPAGAEAVSTYGAGSDCRADADGMAVCEAACAALLNDAHHANPASETCDDGTGIPSNDLDPLYGGWFAVSVSGSECDQVGDDSTVHTYSETDTLLMVSDLNAYNSFQADFYGVITGHGGGEPDNGSVPVWDHPDADCTNDGLNVTCTSPSTGDQFDGVVSDDLDTLQHGTYTFGSLDCTFTTN